jgi:hypothetical protein
MKRTIMKTSLPFCSALTAVAVLIASAALAQKPQVVKGKIASVEGSTVTVDQAKGAGQAKVKLKDKAVIMTVGKATLGEIKPGAYIGVGAMPQADGSQKAIRVMIFPEAQRGTGEGHYPWTTPGSVPNSTMTNATVDTTVTSVEGQVLTVKYKGGTQKIVIGPDANIASNIPGTINDLKPGTNITIPAAETAADGSLETARVNIGRDGFVP